MPPIGPVRHLVATFVIAVAAVSVAACSGSPIPVATFDPASACTTDGRQAGAYPDLEALLPPDYQGIKPTNVDSGRNCTKEALGTLATAGIAGVRFAGATWSLGGTTGLTFALFAADGLTPAEMIDFYGAGAQASSKTDTLQATDTAVRGRPGRRLDVLQSDGAAHTIVAWPSTRSGVVDVLLATDLGDTKVANALIELAAR
jgi:hypothetical protein